MPFLCGGHARRWPRHRSVENTLQLAEKARGITDRIGLVGASSQITRILMRLRQDWWKEASRISCASLRAETVRPPCSTRLPIATRALSRLRRKLPPKIYRKVVNKAIPRERLYHVLEEAVKRDILNLRLYYLIGVPYETPADVEAIVDMAKRCDLLFCLTPKSPAGWHRLASPFRRWFPNPTRPSNGWRWKIRKQSLANSLF